MDKTIQLDMRELQMAQGIDQELMQAWAQIGVLSEQYKSAEKARDQAIEKQRGLIKQVVAAHGIERYRSAAPGANGTIVVTMLDEAEVIAAEPPPVKPNGIPQVIAGEV